MDEEMKWEREELTQIGSHRSHAFLRDFNSYWKSMRKPLKEGNNLILSFKKLSLATASRRKWKVVARTLNKWLL